jgi:hypothetical protein
MSVESKFKLLWDKIAGRQLEQDAQESLRKGTDPSKAKANLTAVERGMEGLKQAAYRLGYAIGAAFAISKIKDFAASSIKEFGAAEAVWSRLEGTLANVGVSMTDVRAEIDATVSSMEGLTAMGDEDVASALTTLVQLSGDYTGSLKRLQLVADLAAGANISYEQSAELVGKAMAGNTMLLTRMFPALKDSTDILGDLAALQNGMAERQRGTWAGGVKVLSNEWGNFKEAVGEALVNAGNGTSILETLTGVVRGLAIWVGENQPAFDRFGDTLARIADRLGQLPGRFQDWKLAVNRRHRTLGLDAPFDETGLTGAGGTWDVPKAPPPSIIPSPRRVPLSDEEKEAAKERVKALLQYTAQITGDSGADSARAKGIAGAIGSVLNRAVPERGLNLERIGAGARSASFVEPRELSRVEQGFYDLWTNVTAASENAAYQMSAAFEDAFRLMLEEGATVGNFFEGLGRGLAGSMLQGLSDFFRVKVKQNIAAAIEAAAFALGFTSHGNFASASAAWASAGQHAAAAAAYAAAAGASGAGRAAITGGRGAAPASTRDVGLDAARGTTPAISQALIYVDPFNPANPIHVRQIGKGMALDVRLSGKPEWAK